MKVGGQLNFGVILWWLPLEPIQVWPAWSEMLLVCRLGCVVFLAAHGGFENSQSLSVELPTVASMASSQHSQGSNSSQKDAAQGSGPGSSKSRGRSRSKRAKSAGSAGNEERLDQTIHDDRGELETMIGYWQCNRVSSPAWTWFPANVWHCCLLTAFSCCVNRTTLQMAASGYLQDHCYGLLSRMFWWVF